MPELPEVENICIYLRNHLISQNVSDIYVKRNDLRIKVNVEALQQICTRQITSIHRRAKYLVITTTKLLSEEIYLIIHLGMSGKLLLNSIPHKHDCIVFSLQDGNTLTLNDYRRFSSVQITSCLKHFFKDIGPEPLQNTFDFQVLLSLLCKSNVNIKAFLLNGKNIAGIGNIYAAEILFAARISPLRKTIDLAEEECTCLIRAIKTVLSKAISLGGSTFKDYRTPDGKTGSFQQTLRVYLREHEPCIHCNTEIKRIIQNRRSSFYCPQCQK